MFKKAAQFLRDVRTEMSKVSWPKKEELLNSTIIVAVVSVLFTIFIFSVDYILSWVMRFVMQLF